MCMLEEEGGQQASCLVARWRKRGEQQASCVVAKKAVEFPWVLASKHNYRYWVADS